MQLAAGDRRPAYLTEIHAALTSLTEHDQARLGVIAGWKTGPHQLTYRQVEHTVRLITRALSKTEPGGAPSAGLQRLCDQLTETSIPGELKDASSSPAVGWPDVEAWSRPVPADSPGTGTDPEARWGHRNVNRKIQEGEMFFGFYPPFHGGRGLAVTLRNGKDDGVAGHRHSARNPLASVQMAGH